MKRSRRWLLAIALVLSLTVAAGGTLAYMTDRDTVVNTFTLGDDVEVGVLEINFVQGTRIRPGEAIDKDAMIANGGAKPVWVWLTVSVHESLADYVQPNWASGYTAISEDPVIEDGQAVWTVLVDEPLASGQSTGKILDSVTLFPYMDYQNGQYVAVHNNSGAVTLDDLEGIVNHQLIVTVTGYATQVAGFESGVEEAYRAIAAQYGFTVPQELAHGAAQP